MRGAFSQNTYSSGEEEFIRQKAFIRSFKVLHPGGPGVSPIDLCPMPPTVGPWVSENAITTGIHFSILGSREESCDHHALMSCPHFAESPLQVVCRIATTRQ